MQCIKGFEIKNTVALYSWLSCRQPTVYKTLARMHRQCNNIMPINCWLFGCKALLQQWNQVVSIHSEFLKNRTLHSCYQAFFFFFFKKLNICTYTWFDQSFVHDVVQKLSIEWYRKTKDKIEAYIFNDVHVKFPKNSPSWCLFIENLFLLCSSCSTYITI